MRAEDGNFYLFAHQTWIKNVQQLKNKLRSNLFSVILFPLNENNFMRKRHLTDDTEVIHKLVVETMQDKKAKEIVSLNLKKIHTAVTDYFVICHGNSKTQVDAIAQSILENVKKECGAMAYNKEGFENSEWILIDYVDVVVHVFLESTRSFYQLEKLWADAEKLTFDDED